MAERANGCNGSLAAVPVFAGRFSRPDGQQPAKSGRQAVDRTLIQKCAHFHIETLGELLDHSDRRITRPSLEIADVGAMDTSLERKLLLAQPLLAAQAAEILGKTLTDIHAPEADAS